MHPRKYSEDVVDQIKQMYKDGKSSIKIGDELGISKVTIIYILKRENVDRRTHQELNLKFKCNEHFFDSIDSESKAYWLGFISADGYIRPAPKRILGITLSDKDEHHIQLLKNALGSDHTITKYGGTARLHIYSDFLTSALAVHGVIQNKTFTMEFPSIPQHIIRHFIRGYFDGDGCFTANKSNHDNISFSITSNTKIITSIQEILMKECLFR